MFAFILSMLLQIFELLYSNSNISTTTTQFLLASGIRFESFMTFFPDIY